MAEFLGRERELGFLDHAWRAPGPALIPVYGRRRVGKTELILRFLRDKPAVYHVGKRAPAALLVREFLDAAAAALDEPLLATFPAPGWKAALEAVGERWKRPGRLAIALDEFQWTAGASPELPSVLQELWDRRWSKGGRVMLILCGSFVGFMEREVLGRKSPLFGRRTGQIRLAPFGYREAALFHPRYSLLDRARTYFVCGGVPLYLRHFSPDASIEQNLERTLLDEFGPLYREPEFLLREELREVDNYHAVLLAVAAGAGANRLISRQTGIGERKLHYYLQQLVDLGYLARRHPLTGERPAARHVRYALEDPLLRFWFRFVYPHLSLLARLGPRRTLRERIRPEIESYFGTCFERLCREALPRLYEREGVGAACEVGEYWDKDVQIDVVGLRNDRWTDLGECRFGAVRSAPALVAELDAKVARYPNPRGATLGRRLFTRDPVAGRGGRDRGVRWHSLEDLYR